MISPTLPAAVLEEAARHAASSAQVAGVRIEAVADPARLHAAAQLFADVWSTEAGRDPLPADVLRALVHADGAVHLAYSGSGVVGASAAIHCSPAAGSVYSLIAGAASSDRGVGFALKHAQRTWALGHGVASMVWTYDPLSSRNARFNLVKLGAVARDYTVDFYGPLDDGVNAGDETDRLTTVWALAGPRTAAAAYGRHADLPGPDPASSTEKVDVAPDGGPLTLHDAGGLWCRVPTDIVAVRRQDPELAARWRSAVREVFVAAFARGLAATSMTRDGWYRLEGAEQP
jgi:predicted GNAT superfamily acetyltransferase